MKTDPQPGVELVEKSISQSGPGEVLIKVDAAAICGTDGCFSEYAIAPAKVTFVMPEGMSFEEGALLEPAGCGKMQCTARRDHRGQRLQPHRYAGGEIPINIAKNINTKGITVTGVFGRCIWKTWWNVAGLISAKKISLLDVVTHRFSLDQYEEAFQQGAKGSGKVLFLMK